jgi:hypothetical protein
MYSKAEFYFNCLIEDIVKKETARAVSFFLSLKTLGLVLECNTIYDDDRFRRASYI